MNLQTKQLYLFMTTCSGNWRNSIYIKCQEEKDTPGYLLTTNRDGQPIVMTVEQFQQLTGVQIDPTECCGQLTEAAFESLYAQYLLWHCSSAREHPLMTLCKNYPGLI